MNTKESFFKTVVKILFVSILLGIVYSLFRRNKD